jgi:hypothetical protein
MSLPRSQATSLGNRNRLKKFGYCFTLESQIRGGQVSMHNRYHIERFNPRCVICLEELLNEQITLFKRYEI